MDSLMRLSLILRCRYGLSAFKNFISLFDLQHCQKCLLGQFDLTELLHPLFPLFLFLKQFSLAGYIAAVTFCKDILSDLPDALSCNNFITDCSLNNNLKHLPRNDFPQFFCQLTAFVISLISVDYQRERINDLP